MLNLQYVTRWDVPVGWHKGVITVTQGKEIESIINHYIYGLKVSVVIIVEGNEYIKFGVGKSYTGLKIMEMFDPVPHIDKVVFTPSDFKRAMKFVEEMRAESQVVVIDEGGILINSKKWMDMVNRSMADALMTFRNLRGILVICTPLLEKIDKDFRDFANILLSLYKTRDFVYGKIRMLKVVRRYNKTLPVKIPVFYQDTKRFCFIDRVIVEPPKNKELVEEYEKRVTEFKKYIRTKYLEMLEDRVFTYDDYEKLLHEILLSGKFSTPKEVSAEKISLMYPNITKEIAKNLARDLKEHLKNVKTVKKKGE